MPKFIALRKVPRLQAIGMRASVEERRSYLVKDSLVSERAKALRALGLRQTRPEEQILEATPSFQRLGFIGAYIIDTPSLQMAEQAREILEPTYQIVPDIQLALPQPVLSRSRFGRPRRQPYWPTESGISTAHQNGAIGQGVLVGVLDTGCDADHIELRDKRIEFRYIPLNPANATVRACRGFDPDGHGTHVCGIIAGRNVGVAPAVELMVASVIESETLKTSLERIIVALDWMLSQFQREENLSKPILINMSLGFRPEWISGTEYQAAIQGLRLIISTLVEDFDVLPVAAIGNDGPGIVRAPGYFPEVLSVGAVDFSLRPASFSGGGLSPLTGEPEPKIAGYGVNVVSSLERDIERRSLYASMSGTSMAVPYVVGIAALLASANPGLQGHALRQRLIEQAMPLMTPPNRVGAGLARFV